MGGRGARRIVQALIAWGQDAGAAHLAQVDHHDPHDEHDPLDQDGSCAGHGVGQDGLGWDQTRATNGERVYPDLLNGSGYSTSVCAST